MDVDRRRFDVELQAGNLSGSRWAAVMEMLDVEHGEILIGGLPPLALLPKKLSAADVND